MAQKNPNEPFTRITVEEAAAIMAKGNVQVVDVREPHEYNSGHVPGAAFIPINPVMGFIQRKDELSRDEPIIFVCGVGQRSALACEVAASLGLTDLYNLEGGTEAWIKSGRPVDK